MSNDTGGRCLGLWLYIAQKPHATGIKLSLLADNTGGYLVDFYFPAGRKGIVRQLGSCAQTFDAKSMVNLRTRLIPPSTVFVTESFFSSHGRAQELRGCGRPFLMLSKKDKCDAMLAHAKHHKQEAGCAPTIAKGSYEL